ncbi:MBG domain-containing protein [Waltera sp.]|uniref:MBG domain-containing protein n=2 Tax=Waltera sp. TaxID=2815806 RepID=UPI00307F13A3
MKKKNTMPEKDWQQTHEKIRWRELRKRILVMGLTVAMVANTVDLSALSVSAKTDESETGKTTIVSFEELSKDITEQTLPIGALESDIKFPTSLTVTVEKTTQADEKEADDEEDASETGDTEKDDAQKDDSNGDTASSDDKKDTESSDEKDGDSGNADASDKSGTSDNGNADTKDSDTSKDSGNSDKSNNPNGSSSSDTEDTQARADLPSAFGALIGQMADNLLPHKLIVHAAEKDDASDTASTSDGADNAKKTDTASTSDNADSVKTTGSSDAAASSETETTTEKIRLENIKWELNVEESDAEEFDSSEVSNGFCYAYTPVLPDEDGDGNQLVLGKDVELPTIYVLVGEYGIALLADGTIEVTEMKADGTVQKKYNAQDLATWIGGHGNANLEKVSIKLLNDDASITSALTIGTGLAKEIELDLNGHTLKLADNARLYFKRANITITSSGSNEGTITGNYQYGQNRFKGDGLITVDSVLKIEHVTIKNAGTGSTVAMWGGATCTIDEANISGSNGSQEGVITICDSNACTITNTKVTGNVKLKYGAIMFMGSCSDCIIGGGAVIENNNKDSRCIGVYENSSIKITVKKGATLTANAGNRIIMDNEYKKLAVNIEGGTFNGRLRLPDNSQIAEGTFTPAQASGNAIWVNNPKKTLQDLLKVGYTLKYEDGTYADLTARWTDEGKKVTAVKSPLYFTTHPTISSGAETVMENYTAAEAPVLTVKAVSGSDSSGSISYQWYADETINGITTKVKQTGQDAKTATYRIPTGLLAGTYQYYCVATCGEYTATSQKAVFTVEEGVAEVTVGGNTTRYATLTKAFDAVKATVNTADADADLEITLKILKNISEPESEWKIDGGTKKVSFCMDLNGCTVTGKGLYIIGEGVKAVFKDAGTGQNGTLNAPISIQNKAKLTVENGNYKGVLRFVNGAAAKLKDGYYSNSIYIGKASEMDNTDISCTITGGTYEGTEVLVCGGATLSVSGDTAKIKALHIDHREFSQIKRAKVMLSGGKYGEIALSNFDENNDDSLLDEAHGYAIADTLAEGYAFYSAGIKTDISRTDRSQGSVEVLRADTPEDTSQAVVKFQIEKNSGETKTMYFLTWDAAMFYLEGSEEHKKNEEYKLWEKLEILLLKDTIADKSINRMLDKVYLPAEITLRSEGDEPHTLTGRGHYLFMTGRQDVTIENINVVGNISFPGDTAVLRLGEGVTGLKDVTVPSGKAEIVIEKGAQIPDVFTGDESNLNASIYCNHDSADFSSKITQGAGAFKIWFPIELSGIALPTGGENDTNVTQRDGVTYGLYSNGGTTGQKIKVTGEVCSYEPYGGNTVTIDATDLSFTMPSSKVTLKAHTKNDYGYCDSCQKTDLAEAYKNGHLHIEGLVGRTYDSYPQVMTGVTLDTANGNKSLTGPSYKSGRELAQDSTDPANADISKANYYVVYANNIDCYRNEEGGSDFKADEAPKVTITGQGSYYGTIEHYFTIGYGEVVGEGFSGYQGTYDGKAHGAVQYGTVRLKADAVDSQTMIPVADGLIVPCTGKTMETDGFASNFTYYFVLMYYENGVSQGYKQINDPVTENHMITNAGNYTIYVSIHEARKNMCASLPIDVKATIEPRSLTDSVIHLDDIGITVYYTGMPIIPENWDRGITDSNRKNEPGNDQGVLDKDKDFTVSAENNTEVTNGKRDGKITFTGIGNYKGELVRYFDIAHAFTLAQTTVSKNCWYNEDSNWWKNGIPATFTENDVTSDNPVTDWKNIVYRTAKGKYAIVSDEVVFYASLEDAVAGKNPGYTFKEEGTHTVTLYGKDPWNQSIVPVEITINIDTTAPTWADADGKEDGYGIQIKDNWWRTLLNKISFGHLYNDTTLDIKIHANDAKEGVNKVSGVSKYYYYIDQITDTASATGKTKAELDTLAADGKFTQVDAGNWLSDSAIIHGALGEDGSYVVYAYAMDNAGNQSDYICTEGLVQDASAPVVTVTEPKKEDGTLKDTEAILKVNLSEDATLMWFFVSEGVFDGVTDYTYDDCKRDIENYMKGEPKYPQFAVENDGKWAPRNGWNFKPDENLYCGQWEVRKEGLKESNANQNFVASWTPKIFKTTGTKGDNKIEIGNFGKPDVYFPLYPSKKTAVWIAAIDKAGNITALTKPAIEFTTAKPTPYVKTAPVLSGTYGNTVSAMFEKADMTKAVVTAGRNSDTKVEGTWTLAAEDADKLPTVGTSEKYSLVFTPTGSDADTYDSVTCEVTPEVSKKQITVVIADKEKFYGETNPALTWSLASGDAYLDNVLVAGDTEEALGVSLSTTAKDNSDVGTYAITGSSDSANYEVSFIGNGSDGKSGILTVKQAANSFTTELSCSDYTYAKDETPEPNATAKFGTVTYKYAKADSDGNAPAADSAYTDAIPVNAGTYAVKAYVAETDNYAGLTSNPAVFTIAKAAKAPNMPENAMAPAHSTKKVGDITLPDGWSWQEADRDTALADGVAVTANAFYTGTDKGNYETESVSITITRSECDHTHTEIRNQREATCKEKGYTGDTYCKDCGEKLASGTTIEKKPHKVGTPATCVSKAVCSVCSETFGEVDATNHVHTTVKNRKEATCTQTGYAGDTYCTDCDKLLSTGKELAALGHDYKVTVTKQPTTTEEGIRTYTCTRCNSSYTESIAKLPEEKHTHNYTGSITKEATCTEAGVRSYTCSCGDSYTENIPATGHSYVSKVTKAATTTEEGIMTYTCSKCGHSYTQPIAKIKSDDSNKDNGSQNQKPQSGTHNGNQNQKPQPDTDNGKDNGTSIKPYIKDDSGKEGWDVIKPQLEEAKAGDTVTVAMNGTTVVPKDVIDSIKGKDTTLVLDMGNGLSWKINGQDITDAAGDIDFDVTVGADAGKSIPVDVINNVTGERSSMNLTLAYDGEFGFTATLTVNMESKNAGLYANLFYYNEQTGELEFISAGQIDPDGNVELVFTHASDYTIVVDAKIMSDNGQADNKSDETIPAPKTDDSTSKYAWNNTIIIIIGICIILNVFGAVFYVRKKSGSEEE